MRVALVHDYLVSTGGAERVLLSLHRLFPEAPVYTAIHRPETTFPEFTDVDVRPLWPDRLPVDLRSYRPLIPVYAMAFEGLHLEGFDLVLSDASGFAKSAGSRAGRRLCYCYTPPRFIWPCGATSEAGGRAEAAGRTVLGPWLRRLDRAAAARVDSFAVTSHLIQGRVREFYGRAATVLHPPVDSHRFRTDLDRGEHYLVVGRLARYRRFDEAVIAATALGRPLVVVGSGPDEGRLRGLAGPSVSFRGRVGDEELADLYGRARALVVPGEEDWGLAALEANASGTPVIAAGIGGSLETVVDGVSGVLYSPGAPGALEGAIARFETLDFEPARLRQHALTFSEREFHSHLLSLIEETVKAA
jgi:glycosyltransferase involved in cell wall biosynthesis